MDNNWSMKRLMSELKASDDVNFEDFIVIGIDFGTTFSGVAWATAGDFEEEDVNLITMWPGRGEQEGKVPTEIFYDDDRVSWGYDVSHEADPIRWFKLLLLKDEDLSSTLRDSDYVLLARKMLRDYEKTPIDIVADYLRCLWDHVIDTIQRDRGKSLVESLIFKVVITVPAIWRDYAREDMTEAAYRAGILKDRPSGRTTLTFAPEPEAAALATLWELKRRAKPDDVYVICDAGGGTVDIISYKVKSVSPLQLEEAVIGAGDLCGGIFVDEAFQNMCRKRLGTKWSKLSQAGIKELMRLQWENGIKPQFKPNDKSKEYIIAIPAEAFNDKSEMNDSSKKPIIKNGRIHFKSTDIEQAFTQVFARTEKLVDEQIRKSKSEGKMVKGVILVGGLGSSRYLADHLEARYGKQGIDVLQATGTKPRTAICRGAVFKGFLDLPTSLDMDSDNNPTYDDPTAPIRVVSTIARQSLGVHFSTPFQQDVHLEKDKFWDNKEGEWKADNQIRWYLKKGENVSNMEPIRHSFFRTYETSSGFKVSNFHKIICSDADSPPNRGTENVQELCKIRCDVSDIDYDELDDWQAPNGKWLKKWNYHIEMVPSGAATVFSVYYNGSKLGSGNTNVSFK